MLNIGNYKRIVNQNYNEVSITSLQSEWPSSRRIQTGSSLAIQWLGLCAFTAEGPGLISGQGTRILHATRRGQIKKKNLQTISAGEGVEKSEPSYSVGGHVNWYSHYGE